MSQPDGWVFLVILICVPPIAIYMKNYNECSGVVWLNLCLCLLFYIPGIVHAVWYCYFRD